MDPALLFVILTVFCSTLFLTAIKRWNSHRLPLPPGPKGLPLLGYLTQLGPLPHQTFHRLSEKYGPLLHVRLGVVPVVVPCTATVAEKLLRNDIKFVNRPKNSSAEHVAYNYQDIGFLPYGPKWRMQRRLCSLHLFSSKALDDFQHSRQSELARLVYSMAEQSGRALRRRWTSARSWRNVSATRCLCFWLAAECSRRVRRWKSSGTW
ncbi:hypothetical protein HPP92_008965 [Vanilla planifolia]|uniref:Uncharacterized protein n=1 Tax=Vanilla planifolia TaxID=51239 RepID=A0A835V6I2_VANPL|nr:hypothetical protein HPP92_008965 [Vanilla planifolia]